MPSGASKKVRVAVIGAGNMGRNHLRNYFLMLEAELIGLADVNPATKALADEYGTKFYTDYVQMLDELKPEAVSIVVPTPFHFEITKEVIARKIHILLEKPFASTTDEADKLIKLAKEAKIVMTVGHIEHYNPLVIALKELLDRNTIGDITSIICKRVGGFPAVEPKTDVIIDLAVHDIGIISYLLGQQPKSLFSHGSRTLHSKKIDSAEILLDYGRASGFIQANWLTPVKIRTIAITGSGGYVEGNYITQELEYYEHNLQGGDKDFPNFLLTMGEPKKEIIKVDFREPLAEEIGAFLKTVRGEKNVYLVKPEEARDALELALRAVAPYNE